MQGSDMKIDIKKAKGHQQRARSGRSDQQGLRSGGATKQIKPEAKKISEKLTEQIQSLRKEHCIAVGTGQVCSPLTPLTPPKLMLNH